MVRDDPPRAEALAVLPQTGVADQTCCPASGWSRPSPRRAGVGPSSGVSAMPLVLYCSAWWADGFDMTKNRPAFVDKF